MLPPPVPRRTPQQSDTPSFSSSSSSFCSPALQSRFASRRGRFVHRSGPYEGQGGRGCLNENDGESDRKGRQRTEANEKERPKSSDETGGINTDSDERNGKDLYFKSLAPSTSRFFPGITSPSPTHPLPPPPTTSLVSVPLPPIGLRLPCPTSFPLPRPPSLPQPTCVILTTTFGDIPLLLFTQLVPRTTFNFSQLAQQGYYTNTTFHRVVAGFMIQGGDPSGSGRGGSCIYAEERKSKFAEINEHPTSVNKLQTPTLPSTFSFRPSNNIQQQTTTSLSSPSSLPSSPSRYFEDEFDPVLSHKTAGILSMSNCGMPNTNSSQFFITLNPCMHLDGRNSVFGEVKGEAGMRVVRKIGAAEIQRGGGFKPKVEVKILQAKVEQSI